MTKKTQSIIRVLLILGILLSINFIGNVRFGNTAMYGFLDMTEEKRFTLTDGTRQLLRELDEVVSIEILLDGELTANYKRLKESVQQTLEDFRAESGYIEYRFTDPTSGPEEEVRKFQDELAKQGIYPVQERIKRSDQLALKLIYPYAKFYYKGRPAAVNFLYNQIPGMPEDLVLENSIGLLEYQFANIIQKLQSPTRKNVVFTTGHGELNPLETRDFESSLRAFYNTGRLYLDSVVTINAEIDALVVAKPRGSFSQKDKFKIDQYVMNGGKVLWLLDAMRVDLDSLGGQDDYVATDYQLNLDNLLFNYGVRLQPNLLLDYQCTPITLSTGRVGSAAQFENFPYPYHPVIIPQSGHPVVKSINPVNLLFANTIDTTSKTKTPIRRTVLLNSSPQSRLQFNPVRMNFDFLQLDLKPDQFNKGPQIVAVALEGVFPSLYENRLPEAMLSTYQSLGFEFKTRSPESRMIIVADGDVARNEVDYEKSTVAPLGFNKAAGYQFANKEFLINSIEYLLDTKGVIEARSKEVKLRLIDEAKASEQKTYWQLLNVLVPVIFIILFGLVYNWFRRRKYSRT